MSFNPKRASAPGSAATSPEAAITQVTQCVGVFVWQTTSWCARGMAIVANA